MTHFFGLGFIQIKVSEGERYHFYHPSLPAFVDEPHDHRYDFSSNVLKGQLTNTLWNVTPGNSGNLISVTCEEGSNDEIIACGVIECLASFSMIQGSFYELKSDTFHTINPVYDSFGCVITKLHRGRSVKPKARVFRPSENIKICPFSKQLNEDEIWEIVDKCLLWEQ